MERLNQNLATSTATRATIPHTSSYLKNQHFRLKTNERKYDRQFYSMYQFRYKHLKDRVLRAATAKWGDGTKKVDGQNIFKQDKILDIQSGQLCWVIGTVFCDLKNKLDILQDVEKGVDDVLPVAPATYVDAEEEGKPITSVMLEDESGRAVLHNDEFLKKNILVTGCIVAVLGMEIQAGVFEIMDVVYPDPCPTGPLPAESSGKIAIVSGLSISEGVEDDLRLELLKQYLAGELGLEKDINAVKDITRLVVAGDSIKQLQEATSESERRDFVTTNNYGSKNTLKYNPESLVKLDQFLHVILTHMPVSIMPGDSDPAEICLPQQPLHKSLFGGNYRFMNEDRFQNLTNPHWFEFDGIRVLGTSGQNITDILKYLPASTQEENILIQAMESTIKWQDIIPTAPDTLYCYPYDDFDPFLLEDETPHVYFAGNQKLYGLKRYQFKAGGQEHSVRMLSVPRFCETGQIVVLDLKTLESEVVTIELS
ncbi:uncharacterized protein CANTADRAFT_53414 [Suhomyces tanzawaensis NRRL Y-17324]|uniref:DNA-directed DNA polymerase n=1 Tax=Suhomyces tanzawaensis NRRL Y-17324 TaxID=984487 RepID=A0A1E4SGT5_9ASCO|nr:uncharacterized protein CANTADRAFT_53414 [Suhomyces tanzawaensis NRRL Y-17324]ODV78723.1 hypothetical protein CANTADRAFT_53414 [Suhomyces tanzawaensis NRRL Y-17324]